MEVKKPFLFLGEKDGLAFANKNKLFNKASEVRAWRNNE